MVQPGVDRGGASRLAETIDELRATGLVWEGEGAPWLARRRSAIPARSGSASSRQGDITYLAGDLAYHRNKFVVRGFDLVIDVWGADHQAQVREPEGGRGSARRAARAARGAKIGQMVWLASGRMWKRLGDAVDLY